MDEVSQFFKAGLMNIHKNTINKDYKQKTLSDRLDNFSNVRRTTRNTLMFLKRNIDANMSPIPTPDPVKKTRKINAQEKNEKTTKRLELLSKWKAEKEKRKIEEQKKKKPAFKVCHVPDDIGLPNLENVNKAIKGKPIKLNATLKSQFAPPNHKFQPPKNIKPIHMGGNVTNETRATRQNTTLPRNIKLGKSQTGSTAKLNVRGKSQLENNILCRQNSLISAKTKPITTKTNANKVVPAVKTHEPRKNADKKTPTCKNISNSVCKGANNSRLGVQSTTGSVKVSPPKQRKGNLEKKLVVNLTTALKECDDNVRAPRTEAGKDSEKKSIKNVEITRKRKSPKQTNAGKENIQKTPRKSVQRKLDSNTNAGGVQEEVKSKMTRKSSRSKKVDPNVIEIVDSDNEASPASEPIRTPRGKSIGDGDHKGNSETRRTPRRSKKFTKEIESRAISNINSTSSTGSATGSISPDYPIDCLNFTVNNSTRTPIKDASPVYISPFVTVSRGKDSARKEYQVRQSRSGSVPDNLKDVTINSSTKAGAEYFTYKLHNEIDRIQSICDEWTEYKEANDISEEASDMINVAIGQSTLLITKKFKQFQSLIEQCQSCEYVEKPITCMDLHGFWDMIYMQVGDLEKRFQNLTALRENNWEEVVAVKKPQVKRGKGRPKKTSAVSALKDIIRAARNLKKNNADPESAPPDVLQIKQIAEALPQVKSNLTPRLSNGRKSLRVSLLVRQTPIRVSSSPGLTMMKVTQAIKCGDGLTPSKSILKTDLTKSVGRTTKSVLFKDQLEECVEANPRLPKVRLFEQVDDAERIVGGAGENLIEFSPVVTQVRRSHRIGKLN